MTVLEKVVRRSTRSSNYDPITQLRHPMNTFCLRLAVAFVSCWNGSAASAADGNPQGSSTVGGFSAIFNGRDLAGWNQPSGLGADSEWSIRESGLYCNKVMDNAHFSIVCDKVFPSDFSVKFKWKVEAGQKGIIADGNFGIHLSHTQSADFATEPPKYQDHLFSGISFSAGGNLLQIDTIPVNVDKLKNGAREGKSYARFATVDHSHPAGIWNDGEIVVRGGVIEYKVNGKPIQQLDLTDRLTVEDMNRNAPLGELWQERKRAGCRLSLIPLGTYAMYRDIQFKDLTRGEPKTELLPIGK